MFGVRRTTWTALSASLVLATTVIAVGAMVTHHLLDQRRNSVELCERRFRRTAELTNDTEIRRLGDLHVVGRSRSGDELWTVTTAWPEASCEGPTPTLLWSPAGDEWHVWTLVGGP